MPIKAFMTKMPNAKMAKPANARNKDVFMFRIIAVPRPAKRGAKLRPNARTGNEKRQNRFHSLPELENITKQQGRLQFVEAPLQSF